MKKTHILTSLLVTVFFLLCAHGVSAAGTTTSFLPNPLKITNAYDLFIALIRVVIRWFVYPGIIAAWLFSGFSFVLAQGNPEKLVKARRWTMWAAIITAVIFMSEGFLLAIRGTITQIAPNAIIQTVDSSGNPLGTNTPGGLTSPTGQTAAETKSPFIAVTEAVKSNKVAPSAGGCKSKPDPDGTTYHQDPTDPNQCEPDSECAPGYKPDPADPASCELMDSSRACPREDGVTYTLGEDGQCHPTNGGCPQGESPNASDFCVSNNGSPTDTTTDPGSESCPDRYSDGTCAAPSLGSCPEPFSNYLYSKPDKSDCPTPSPGGSTSEENPGTNQPTPADSCENSSDPFKCRCERDGNTYNEEDSTCG